MQSNNHESNKQEQIKVAYENRIDVEYIPPTIFKSAEPGDEGEEKKNECPILPC